MHSKLLASILLLSLTLPARLYAAPDDVAALQAYLWKLEKQFDLTSVAIDLHILPRTQMYEKNGVWGDCWYDNAGSHIEVMAARDFPNSYPRSEIGKMQQRILQHELMHLAMIHAGIPNEIQDAVIELLQPRLARP